MKYKILLCAGAIALGMMAVPAQAGDRDNDFSVQSSRGWQDDTQVSRRNSDRFDQWHGKTKSKRAERAERREARKARKARLQGRRGARVDGGGYVGAGSGGALHEQLDAYDLPSWANPPEQQEPRTFKDALAGYDLPEWTNGTEPVTGPSIGDRLSEYDLPDYIGGQ